MKTLSRFLLFVILLFVGLVSMAWYVTIWRPQPDYEGVVSLEGIREPVLILWDDYGVPHIQASNEEDLYVAVGYAHAQDRLWQLTLQQLVLEGRFAEFLGEDALPLDRYSRTMGFFRTAKAIERETSPEQMRLLSAYSRGVNQYIRKAGNNLPIEFSLLGIRPWEWTPAHTIGVTRLMGWNLTTGWWSKAVLGVLRDRLPPDQWSRLVPEWPADAPSSQDSLAARIFTTETALRSLLNRKGTGVGSNAWVVDGTKSATGYPLLAGDPHLGLDMPGFWYEVHLLLDGKQVSGATIAGAPYVVLGQNDHLAWSFTSLMLDNTDFFRIQVDPTDRSRYVADSSGGTVRLAGFDYVREAIPIKGGATEALEIRLTRFGPVINDIYPTDGYLPDQLLTLRWTGQDISHEAEALYRINWATSFQEFQDALPHFGVTGLNMIYGDRNGNIAMFSIGTIPIRREPLRFRNSWDPADAWSGSVPFEQMPRIINPKSGIISNANNPPVAHFPYYITAFYEPESRQQRILEVLSEPKRFTADDFAALQSDVLSVSARELTPLLLPALQSSEDTLVKMAIPYLLNWDYRYTTTATAATLFDMAFLKLSEAVFTPIMGADGYRTLVELENVPVRLLSGMLKRGEIPDSLIETAMSATVAQLVARFGTETSEWRWEQVHTIRLDPPLFREASRKPGAPAILRLIVNNVLSQGPYPVGGHSRTVNNGQYSWLDPFEMTLGASIRRIVDLGDLGSSRSVLPTGQSGNPLAKHFGDQTQLWLSGKTRIFQHNSRIAETDGIRKLTLQPATLP